MQAATSWLRQYSLCGDPADTRGYRIAIRRIPDGGGGSIEVHDGLHSDGRPYVPDAELSKALTAAKKDPDRVWLGEVSSVVLQQALADLNTAYRNFFASLSGKRKGARVGPPRFRSRRDHRQAIRFTRNARFTGTAGREAAAADDRRCEGGVVAGVAV